MTLMKLALLATLTMFLAAPATAQQKPPANTTPPKPPVAKPRPPAQSTATTVATVTVTDQTGAPIPDVRVMMTGLLDRSGSTQTNGVVKFDGLRAGVYRLRFSKDGFTRKAIGLCRMLLCAGSVPFGKHTVVLGLRPEGQARCQAGNEQKQPCS